jgi:putative spermidine/putrescine transport system ATP-binding protein
MGYLELHNVRKEFANAVAVEDFNLDVARGEFVSFLGPSGCGKTTTLRMIAGFEQPTRGAIRINDEDVTNKPASKRHVGMVFQSYALFPHMTAADNIGFGLKIAGKSSPEIKQRVGEMLDVIQMNDFGGRYPHQLSGGQQQRVALARALAIQPSVLLLDEPLSALDAKIRVELREDIRAIQKRLGITAIYVTHDQEEALSLSDRIVVMNKARIEQVGEPFEIYNFPATRWVAGFVGTINLIDGKIVDANSVSIEGKTLSIASSRNIGAGKAVKLTIRPEAISIDRDGTNSLSGEVESVTFLGSVVRARVRVGNQSLVMDALNNLTHMPSKVGEQISLHMPKEALLVLED